MSNDGKQSATKAPGKDAKPYAKPTLSKGPVLEKITASAIKGSPVLLSDVRLKRDIRAVGRLPNGLTLSRFRYIGSDVEMVGVMAQEVLSVAPDAVLLGPDGYYRVDYGRLGLRCTSYTNWLTETSRAEAA